MRLGLKLSRSYTASRIRCFSGRKSSQIARSVGLIPLTGSTISFFTAFGLEVLLYSDELWTRLPVGILLAMIILLISWYICVVLETKGGFSLLRRHNVLKDGLVGFTRGLRGMTVQTGSDVMDGGAVDAGDGDGRGRVRRFSRLRTLKEGFNRLLPRRQRVSTSTTLFNIDPIEGNVPAPPDTTVVEMDRIINRDVPEGAV